jgi:hypothetical protein
MTPATTESLLRVNGIQAAFGFEFGLDSPRANEGRAGDYRTGHVPGWQCTARGLK